MPPFIQKRFNLYYARLRIPVELREHFKKREFFQSLGTASITEAESKALIVIKNEWSYYRYHIETVI